MGYRGMRWVREGDSFNVRVEIDVDLVTLEHLSYREAARELRAIADEMDRIADHYKERADDQ